VSLRIEYDERAIGQAAAFLDDPQGIRQVLDAIDRLADDPRPAGSSTRAARSCQVICSRDPDLALSPPVSVMAC
jgi:hypothetical protein